MTGRVIKHIVMWKVSGETPEQRRLNAGQIAESFRSLRGRVPGLLHLEIGIDMSGVDYACDVVLYSEFASQAALEAYGNHPEHLRVKREVGDIRIARHQVDYPTTPHKG